MRQRSATAAAQFLCPTLVAAVLLAGASSAAPAKPPHPQVALIPIAEGFSGPTDIAVRSAPNDDRLFVVEQSGMIRTVNGNGGERDTFLDISDRVVASGELGLLGLAFDPGDPDLLYVNYTARLDGQLTSRISRFETAPGGKTAEPASELVILEVEQPFSNHNGGDLAFGPDGYLYIALGDGGSGGDPLDQGQDLGSLLGKILRLDVSGATAAAPYAVPEDNPFAGQAGALDEIWAYGLRNPWRFSFDRLNGDIYVADVGQNRYEEVNHQSDGGKGANYGWRCYEGYSLFNPQGCEPDESYVFPVHAYGHPNDSCASITGGYVYRGAQIAELAGLYVFSDWCTRWLWALVPESGWQRLTLGRYQDERLTTFGQDGAGELYAASSGGRLSKLVDTSSWDRVYLPVIGTPTGAP